MLPALQNAGTEGGHCPLSALEERVETGIKERRTYFLVLSLYLVPGGNPETGREGEGRQGGSVKVSSCPWAFLKFARARLPVLARLLSISAKPCTTELSLNLVMLAILTLERNERYGIGKEKREVDRQGKERMPS